MLKILIIDNNQTFRQMLADILRTNFSSIVMCLDGNHPDIMNQFSLFSPDVLFIDVQSMEKNCMTVTKSFKNSQPDLCVIWITSWDQPEYVQKAQDGGIDYCLSKNAITSDGIIGLIRMVYRACGVAP